MTFLILPFFWVINLSCTITTVVLWDELNEYLVMFYFHNFSGLMNKIGQSLVAWTFVGLGHFKLKLALEFQTSTPQFFLRKKRKERGKKWCSLTSLSL